MDIEPLTITSFLQKSFSRRKTREMFDKLVEDWHNSISSAMLKENCQHLISTGINQTKRSKPPAKKTERQDLNLSKTYHACFLKKMKVTYRNLKLEVKVWCWEAKALENMKGHSRAEGRKRLYKRYCFRYFRPLRNPKYELSCDAFDHFPWQTFNYTFECWQMSCQNQPITEH